jgi:hypothetical protein
MCTFHICLQRSLISTRFRCSVSRSIFPREKLLSWAPRRASVRAFVRECVIYTHTHTLWRCIMHTLMHRGLCDGPLFVSLCESVGSTHIHMHSLTLYYVHTHTYVCVCVDNILSQRHELRPVAEPSLTLYYAHTHAYRALRRASVRVFVRQCVKGSVCVYVCRCIMHTLVHTGLCDGLGSCLCVICSRWMMVLSEWYNVEHTMNHSVDRIPKP